MEVGAVVSSPRWRNAHPRRATHLITDLLHPTVIVQGYTRALQEALDICERMAKVLVDVEDEVQMP